MAQTRASKPARRGVLDPRLFRLSSATRTFILATSVLGVLIAVLIVAQAWLLADVIAGAVVFGRGLTQLRVPLALLLAVVLARGLVVWAAEVLASRCSAGCKQQLRGALLTHIAALGPGHLAEAQTGAITVLATRGIDALDGYFSLYLPQVVLAAIVPLAVIGVILVNDWISALIIVVTVPLIPLFMVLVGVATRERTRAELHTLQRLATHFLDVVGGLPTLKVFGRAKRQIGTIRAVGERHRATAMATLRVTFLSSLILELLATVSVAVVAVAVGLRLLGGHLDLRTALFVLVLAPEAYIPLRQLGANFHASAEGLATADQVFAVLERPLPQRGCSAKVPNPAESRLSVDGLTVVYPGCSQPALDAVGFSVEPGEILAVTGPSGSGKSTLLGVLLGFLAAERGSVSVGDTPLAEVDPDRWREQLAWVPQRPHLFAASIAENIRLGTPGAPDHEIRKAAFAAGLKDVVSARSGGLGTMLGEHGAGLSAGERQRVALARAFLRDAPLLLLDEPTANLDGATEEQVLVAVRELVRGRTAIVVAHRPALVSLADRVLDLDPAAVAA